MYIAIAIMLVLWGAFTYALHKKKLQFFKFLSGSIGTFLFSAIVLKGIFYMINSSILMNILKIIGDFTNTFQSYIETSSVTVFHNSQVLSFYVSYECSGVIEFLVYMSLLLFYPIYSNYDKLKYLIIGFLAVVGSNLIRLIFIIFIVKIFGNEAFFWGHIVVGRTIYFGLIIILYYNIFTKPHVRLKKEKCSHV